MALYSNLARQNFLKVKNAPHSKRLDAYALDFVHAVIIIKYNLHPHLFFKIQLIEI